MRGRAKAATLGLTALLLAALAARALKRAPIALEPPPPFSVSGRRVTLAAGSKFARWLEVTAVGQASSESAAFRTVGQIIALSNTSGELVGNPVGWVELDPRLSRSIGLDLTRDLSQPVGTAYGLTMLPSEYAGRIVPGERVEIMRYGLRDSSVQGRVTRIIPRADAADVVFRFPQGQDWFPGTNCQVVFPVLRGHPVRIPTTAPVHEGAQEYVWKEVGPGQFEAQGVSIVDATPDYVAVVGLGAGDRIVARGAILLKPLLRGILGQTPRGG